MSRQGATLAPGAVVAAALLLIAGPAGAAENPGDIRAIGAVVDARRRRADHRPSPRRSARYGSATAAVPIAAGRHEVTVGSVATTVDVVAGCTTNVVATERPFGAARRSSSRSSGARGVGSRRAPPPTVPCVRRARGGCGSPPADLCGRGSVRDLPVARAAGSADERGARRRGLGDRVHHGLGPPCRGHGGTRGLQRRRRAAVPPLRGVRWRPGDDPARGGRDQHGRTDRRRRGTGSIRCSAPRSSHPGSGLPSAAGPRRRRQEPPASWPAPPSPTWQPPLRLHVVAPAAFLLLASAGGPPGARPGAWPRRHRHRRPSPPTLDIARAREQTLPRS